MYDLRLCYVMSIYEQYIIQAINTKINVVSKPGVKLRLRRETADTDRVVCNGSILDFVFNLANRPLSR
ncbi:unnamed protein product [Leptosia nina]|uniref:Uncharacterized protein n=1 Tax=Leptosia nina TaxID=320188 RepID=A0AAV1JDG9_9NEOP